MLVRYIRNFYIKIETSENHRFPWSCKNYNFFRNQQEDFIFPGIRKIKDFPKPLKSFNPFLDVWKLGVKVWKA